MLYTGPRGYAHYFEFFVQGCKSVRPYLSPLRTEDRVGFAQGPLFVDIVGLTTTKEYQDACRSLTADSREAKLPVAIPDGNQPPGQGLRPELRHAKAFVGDLRLDTGYVLPAPGAKALILVPGTNGSADPLSDGAIAWVLDTREAMGFATVYAPSPSSIASDEGGVAAVEAELANRGLSISYSTDPEPAAVRAVVGDSTAVSIIAKALRGRRWRIEVQPASRAKAMADRQSLSLVRREDDRVIELFVPAGLRSLEVVRLAGHELLRIEGCPRLESSEVDGAEAQALKAFGEVLSDDLLRRRFGDRLRSLRLGAYEWALDPDRAKRPKCAQARMVEVAAAVTELLCQPEGYDVPALIERARQLSPGGVVLGERTHKAISGIANPTDHAEIMRTLRWLSGEIPLPGVRVADGLGD